MVGFSGIADSSRSAPQLECGWFVLVRNRTLLAPVAGSLIILFGLHLMGWLVKISVRVGLIFAGVLIAIGVALNLKGVSATSVGKDAGHVLRDFAWIFLIGPTLTRWLNFGTFT